MSGPHGLWLSPRQGRRLMETQRSPPMSASNHHPELSPYERVMRRRRRTLVRDWILVAIALGLAITAGVFRNDRGGIPAEPAPISSPSVQ